MGIGPLFICFLIFDATKKLFDGWIGQVLTATFMTILTAAMVRLILSVMESYLKSANAAGVATDPAISQALPTLVLCLITALILMQVPSMAAGLGGGVAVNTLSAAGWAYNKLKGSVSAGKDLASGKTLSDMRGQRRAKETNKNGRLVTREQRLV